MEKKLINNRLSKDYMLLLTIIMYAVYAIKCVWLAFAYVEYSPLFYYIMLIPVGLCLPLGIITIINQKKINIQNKWMLILPFVYFLFNVLHSYQDLDIVSECFTLIVITSFVLFSSQIKIGVFDVFYWTIQVLNIFSIIIFILYLFSINIGFEIVPYYANSYANYVKWFVFAIYRSRNELRLCGIFNEPGALGTVCALLFAARFNYSKLWEKIIIIITITITFSLAGYIIVFIYLSLYAIKKNKRNIIFVMLFLALFISLPLIDWNNEIINSFFSRFAVTKTGLAGDNRTNIAFDQMFYALCNGNDKWLGYGCNYPLPDGVLTYKSYIVEYGFIGFILWMFIWIRAALKESKLNRYCLLFIGCFLISLYQRPRLISSIYGYVLLFGGIEWIKSQDKHNIEDEKIPSNMNKKHEA